MALLIEMYSVIVPRRSLAAHYPGGTTGFQQDFSHPTFRTDDHLCQLSFMAPVDAEHFAARLARNGLTPKRDGIAVDVAVVSSQTGPLYPCPWLELERNGNQLIAWMKGTDRGSVCAPLRARPGESLEYVTEEAINQRYEHLRTEGEVEYYRNRETGDTAYQVRRAKPADDERQQELYQRAYALAIDHIRFQWRRPAPLTVADREKLAEALRLFNEVVHLEPAHWMAMFMIGKIFQRCDVDEEALRWLAHAHRVNPDHPDVAREASIEAMQTGQIEQAISFCRRALETNPDDAGLRANLALALLFSMNPREAKVVADDALRRDPANHITASIVGYINDVIAGRRKCPRHVREMV